MGNKHAVRQDRPALPWVGREVRLDARVRIYGLAANPSCRRCPTDSYQLFCPLRGYLWEGKQRPTPLEGGPLQKMEPFFGEAPIDGRTLPTIPVIYGRESKMMSLGKASQETAPAEEPSSTEGAARFGLSSPVLSIGVRVFGLLNHPSNRGTHGMDAWSVRSIMADEDESGASMPIHVSTSAPCEHVFGRGARDQAPSKELGMATCSTNFVGAGGSGSRSARAIEPDSVKAFWFFEHLMEIGGPTRHEGPELGESRPPGEAGRHGRACQKNASLGDFPVREMPCSNLEPNRGAGKSMAPSEGERHAEIGTIFRR